MIDSVLATVATDLAIEAVIFDIDITDDPMMLLEHMRRKRPSFHTFLIELALPDFETVKELAEKKYNRCCRLAATL
mgnify:CR=1 FL=1